jgi:hypothetical protein
MGKKNQLSEVHDFTGFIFFMLMWIPLPSYFISKHYSLCEGKLPIYYLFFLITFQLLTYVMKHVYFYSQILR